MDYKSTEKVLQDLATELLGGNSRKVVVKITGDFGVASLAKMGYTPKSNEVEFIPDLDGLEHKSVEHVTTEFILQIVEKLPIEWQD